MNGPKIIKRKELEFYVRSVITFLQHSKERERYTLKKKDDVNYSENDWSAFFFYHGTLYRIKIDIEINYSIPFLAKLLYLLQATVKLGRKISLIDRNYCTRQNIYRRVGIGTEMPAYSTYRTVRMNCGTHFASNAQISSTYVSGIPTLLH